MKKFLVLMALLLWPVGALTPQVPKPGQEFLRGQALFQILDMHHDEAVVVPVLPTHFRISRLKGDEPLAEGIARCSVVARTLDVNPTTGLITSITVLKCGHSEWGVKEVDFTYENNEAK